jgi:hypothetical protein
MGLLRSRLGLWSPSYCRVSGVEDIWKDLILLYTQSLLNLSILKAQCFCA